MSLPPLTPQQLARWRRLAFNTGRSFPGGSGRKLGPRTGGSIEFADYRGYAPGDDLRTLDWNLYARSERLFVRTYRKEQELKLDLLVDASASMGDPHPVKYRTAAGLAAAFAYAGLCGGHAVRLGLLRDGDCEASAPANREAAFPALRAFLDRRGPEGATRLVASLERFLAQDAGRAFLVLLSDLLDPHAPRAVPAALAQRGHEVHVLHLVAPEELRPAAEGPAVLVDRETGASREVLLDGETVERCERAVGDQLERWRETAARHGFYYRVLNAALPLDEALARIIGPREMLAVKADG